MGRGPHRSQGPSPPLFLLLAHISPCRCTASAQNSPRGSTGARRECLSEYRSIHSSRTRTGSTRRTCTLPAARSRCSRWDIRAMSCSGSHASTGCRLRWAVTPALTCAVPSPPKAQQGARRPCSTGLRRRSGTSWGEGPAGMGVLLCRAPSVSVTTDGCTQLCFIRCVDLNEFRFLFSSHVLGSWPQVPQ